LGKALPRSALLPSLIHNTSRPAEEELLHVLLGRDGVRKNGQTIQKKTPARASNRWEGPTALSSSGRMKGWRSRAEKTPTEMKIYKEFTLESSKERNQHSEHPTEAKFLREVVTIPVITGKRTLSLRGHSEMLRSYKKDR